jgi:hypothetical protein
MPGPHRACLQGSYLTYHPTIGNGVLGQIDRQGRPLGHIEGFGRSKPPSVVPSLTSGQKSAISVNPGPHITDFPSKLGKFYTVIMNAATPIRWAHRGVAKFGRGWNRPKPRARSARAAYGMATWWWINATSQPRAANTRAAPRGHCRASPPIRQFPHRTPEKGSNDPPARCK